MADLDSLETYPKLDPSGMGEHIRNLPRHCHDGYALGLALPLPPQYSDVTRVVILGMGGSAISGDLLRTIAGLEGRIVVVHRDYGLPPLLDEHTLIIASSYSGETEETVSSFLQALETPSRKLALTTGGELGRIAQENGVPLIRIGLDAPPRATLGYSLFTLLGLFQSLGLISDKSKGVAETEQVLEELSGELYRPSPIPQNMAKRLAMRLFDHLPVIYGAGILSDVARRWKTQLNENSKSHSFYEVFPELNHNSVVGYRFPKWASQGAFVVMLSSTSLHERILARYKITGELLNQSGIGYEMVTSRGENPLAQMMSLVLLGDYVSYYLAMLYEVDPSPVSAIDYLKGRLGEE